ncbi:MAG: hypothetical protein J5706_02740 [Elusimicrobiales bacterium]|nr:hypothetical protein [Elusimicrobiales bacterium]
MSYGKKNSSKCPFGGASHGGGKNFLPQHPAAKIPSQQRRKHCGSHRGNPKNFQIH